MSRIGKKPIQLPQGVTATMSGNAIAIKGPKGTFNLSQLNGLAVSQKDGVIKIDRNSNDKQSLMNHGTMSAYIRNAIKGVTQGFSKELSILGTGYTAKVQGQTLILEIGYVKPVSINIPKDLKVQAPKPNIVQIEGLNKQQVGDFAAIIRAVRPVEPYNLKGIKYSDEIIQKKVSKKQAAV